MFLWTNFEFLEKYVVPQFFHVFPVRDQAILDWVANVKTISPLKSLVADKNIF